MTEASGHHADELNVQLPGRMMMLEILIILLLREHRHREDILVTAETIMAELDGISAARPTTIPYERQVLDVAHTTLAKIALEARPLETVQAPKKRPHIRR